MENNELKTGGSNSGKYVRYCVIAHCSVCLCVRAQLCGDVFVYVVKNLIVTRKLRL